MMTIMLADDNKIALARFSGMVQWEKLGFRLVEMAVDGIDAWKKFCRFYPDVVITDIRMPGVDGIELAKRIKEKKPETIVIFLSSYDEFDYARSAIDLNVQEYILKQELDAAMLEKKLCEMRQVFETRKKKQRKVEYRQLLSCFRTPLQELDTDFFQEAPGEPFGFLVVEQDHMLPCLALHSGFRTPEADHAALIPAVLEAVSQIKYLMRLKAYRWICLYDAQAKADEIAFRIKSALESGVDDRFSIVIFGSNLSLYECKQKYEEMQFVFEQNFFEESGSVVHINMCEKPAPQKRPDVTEMLKAIEEGQGEAALGELDKMYILTLHSYNYEMFSEITEAVLGKLEEIQRKAFGKQELYDEKVLRLTNVRRVARWLKQKTISMTEEIRVDEQFESETMNKAVKVIYQEYSNAFLSVEEIAEQAGLSVNRLNDLFKKEKQETVGRFLTRVRMEKAKKLLEENKEKIPEIGKLVGYTSASYFARVFRKQYGMSPQEYKQERKV